MWQSAVVNRIEAELVVHLEHHLEAFFAWSVSDGASRTQAETWVHTLDWLLLSYNGFLYLQDERSLTPERTIDFLLNWLRDEQSIHGAERLREHGAAIQAWLRLQKEQGNLPPERIEQLGCMIDHCIAMSESPKKRTVVRERDFVPTGLIQPQELSRIRNDSASACASLDEWIKHSNENLCEIESPDNILSIPHEQRNDINNIFNAIEEIERCLCEQVSFERWLLRCGVNHDQESDTLTAMNFCCEWLEKGHTLLQTRNDNSSLSSLINRYDKTLWALRHEMARSCGLDIRGFLL